MGRPRNSKNKDKSVESVVESGVALLEAPDNMTNELETANNELDTVRKQLEDAKRELIEAKKAGAKRDLSDSEIASIDKSITNGNSRSALAAKIEKMRIYDSEMVTGKFLNLRNPGKSEKLTYGKYATDVDKWVTFAHGATYTICRGFADQINEYYADISYDKSDKENQALEPRQIRRNKYAFVTVV